MKVGIGADVLFPSVEFNLNSAVAAAGNLGSISESSGAEEELGGEAETTGCMFIAREHMVAIGTGMMVIGIGPIELVPKEMYVVGPVGFLVDDSDDVLVIVTTIDPAGVESGSIPAKGAPPSRLGRWKWSVP